MLAMLTALLCCATPDAVAMTVRYPDGSPAADLPVSVGVWAIDGDRRYTANPDDLRTDAGGVVRFDLPEEIYILRIFMDPPGHLPLNVHWEEAALKNGEDVPAEFAITLHKGVTIGGRVVDDEGRPVEGASVLATVSYQADIAERYRDKSFPAYDVMGRLAWHRSRPTTDADGRWTTDNAPPDADISYSLEVRHPDFIQPSGESTSVAAGPLRERSAVTRLSPALAVEGRVVDPDGRPVEGATVFSDGYPHYGPKVRTDADGGFRLSPLGEAPIPLLVTAEGFAPWKEITEPTPATKTAATEVVLGSGRPLSVVVTDGSGTPVPQPYVQFTRWKGAEGLHSREPFAAAGVPGRGGENGVFTWLDAPTGDVEMMVSAKGYAHVMVRATLPAGVVPVTLSKPLILSGRVVDDATGEPVSVVRVTPFVAFERGMQSASEFDSETLSDGTFRIERRQSDVRHGLMFEATGYRSTQVGPYAMGADVPALTVRLSPAETLRGRVFRPDGEPAAGAKLEVGVPMRPATLASGGGGLGPRPVYADEEGRFELPSPEGLAALVVTHESGAVVHFGAAALDLGEIPLEPWATATGTAFLNGKPVEGGFVSLITDFPGPPQVKQLVVSSRSGRVDAAGEFRIERVLPGSTRVMLIKERETVATMSAPVDLVAGEETTFDVGDPPTP